MLRAISQNQCYLYKLPNARYYYAVYINRMRRYGCIVNIQLCLVQMPRDRYYWDNMIKVHTHVAMEARVAFMQSGCGTIYQYSDTRFYLNFV